MTLLCDRHHREAGSLLPNEQIEDANDNPFNLRAGVSKPYDLHFDGHDAAIDIGKSSFRFRGSGEAFDMPALIIDGIQILGFTFYDSHLFLNLILFNEFNEIVAIIDENQLSYSTSFLWDIEFQGKTLVIREGHGKILLKIQFDPPSKISILSARLLCNGIELKLRDGKLELTGGMSLELHYSQCRNYGLVVGADPHGRFESNIAKISRYGKNTGDLDLTKWVVVGCVER